MDKLHKQQEIDESQDKKKQEQFKAVGKMTAQWVKSGHAHGLPVDWKVYELIKPAVWKAVQPFTQGLEPQ